MITNRYIENGDYEMLEKSLAVDEYHQGTTIDFFKEEVTSTSIYFFDDLPILFVRGKPFWNGNAAAIQLDIQFLNNASKAKNMIVMLKGFYELEQNARSEGFSAFIFNSTVPLLRKFCTRRLGFSEWDENILVKVLEQVPIDNGPGEVIE